MEYSMPAVKIFACTQSTELASKIAQEYGIELGKIIFSHFSDGEFQPSFEESVRGTRVFLIGSTQPSSENLMEMLLMIDAAKRASAKHITAVIPYLPSLWPICLKQQVQHVSLPWIYMQIRYKASLKYL